MSNIKHNYETIDGIRFDSELEADYYRELLKRKNAGQVGNILVHPSYELIPSFECEGVKHKAITYEADFEYYDYIKKTLMIVDIKGMETPDFKIKYKLFEYIKKQHLTILKRVGDQWLEKTTLQKKKRSKRSELIAEKNLYKSMVETNEELTRMKSIVNPSKRDLNKIERLENKYNELKEQINNGK